jgi:hypothetical protein
MALTHDDPVTYKVFYRSWLLSGLSQYVTVFTDAINLKDILVHVMLFPYRSSRRSFQPSEKNTPMRKQESASMYLGKVPPDQGLESLPVPEIAIHTVVCGDLLIRWGLDLDIARLPFIDDLCDCNPAFTDHLMATCWEIHCGGNDG